MGRFILIAFVSEAPFPVASSSELHPLMTKSQRIRRALTSRKAWDYIRRKVSFSLGSRSVTQKAGWFLVWCSGQASSIPCWGRRVKFGVNAGRRGAQPDDL
mgnify:CR=1 FL=1